MTPNNTYLAVFLGDKNSAKAKAWFALPEAERGKKEQDGMAGWKAWAQVAGNPNWYSIEHADNGNPAEPLTQAQIDASAQIVELLSRDSVGRFKLQRPPTSLKADYRRKRH